MRASECKLIEAGQPHGIASQLNIYVPDVASYRTGYGAHNRIVVGLSYTDFEAREDLRGLPEATDAQIKEVIRAEWGNVRIGKLESFRSDDGRAIYHTFKAVR